MTVWIGTPKNNIQKVDLSEDQWSMLERLSQSDSEYWMTAHDFITRNNGRALSSLTQAQYNWFCELDASLDVELWRREGRIAWGLEEEDLEGE